MEETQNQQNGQTPVAQDPQVTQPLQSEQETSGTPDLSSTENSPQLPEESPSNENKESPVVETPIQTPTEQPVQESFVQQ